MPTVIHYHIHINIGAKLNTKKESGKHVKMRGGERLITKKISNITSKSENGQDACPNTDKHANRDLQIKIGCLVEESNKDYIKEGYYLDGNHCRNCKKQFVIKITNPQTETTITIQKPAYRCEGQSMTSCTYVWCNKCYIDVLMST